MGYVYLILIWFVVMIIGYTTLRLFKFIFNAPKNVKNKIRSTVDNTIDRAVQRNGLNQIQENHNYDIKVLNQYKK